LRLKSPLRIIDQKRIFTVASQDLHHPLIRARHGAGMKTQHGTKSDPLQ
jgi:hypothetical protein